MKVSKIVVILLIVLSLASAGIYLYLKFAKSPVGTIKVKVGDDFIIALKANRTTGYEWQIDKPLDGNKIKYKKFSYAPDETGLVGSGGMEEWRFEAVGAGRARVSFKYVRPWEKDVKPADKRSFGVDIKK